MVENIIKNLDLSAKGLWFPITLGIIALGYMLFMPKRLSWREIYFMYGVSAFVSITLDVIILGSEMDVFDLGNAQFEGIGDLLSYGIIAPCYAVTFLNYLKEERKWMYVIIFTLLSFISELVLVKVGYMKLKGWNTWFSLPVYIVVFGYWLPWQLRLLRITSTSGNEMNKNRVSNKINAGSIFRIKQKAK